MVEGGTTVAPKVEVGAVVGGVGRPGRGWPFLSPKKPSDKLAMWSLVLKMWGRVGAGRVKHLWGVWLT